MRVTTDRSKDITLADIMGPSKERKDMEAVVNHVKFTDADLVNPDNFVSSGEYNPHNVRPWLLHDCGFVLGVVFADSLQDALDEAIDDNRLDRYLVNIEDTSPNAEWRGYGATVDEVSEQLSSLGNASELFDLESLEVVELVNPPFSFVVLYNAHQTV